MRIVQLTPLWSATMGGPSRYVACLQRELRDRGHEVRVVTTDGGPDAEVVSGFLPLVRRLRRLEPEVVHVHNSARLLAAALLSRTLRSKIPVLFTFHTQPVTRVFLPGLGLPQRDYGVAEAALARFLFGRADLVTTVSESIVERHNELYDLEIRRYSRIPSGGDPRAPGASSTGSAFEGRPILVSVGVMTWDWKVLGHLVAIRAVAELRRSYPRVLLLIAGDGPHRNVVEREVAALGLGDHVRLLGNVATDRLLDAADVYVHMAMNEGCSLSIIEAMHAAKPIVAANAGGTPEVLADGDSALLIEPEPGQLVAAVQKLVAAAPYAQKLAARAREIALQQYTWAVVADQYAATYRSLLSADSVGSGATSTG